ncbi:MAG: phospholipid carrier-dependent glycosyltransferase, partial [Chloroflexi bacterium]|nr:phospholipid carrier-dependent glycosyltransferase [Chloroflexota bacterium]
MWVVTVRPLYVLAGIVALAAFLRLWRLDEVGFGNLYYAATVRSMLTSPSNLLFGAFDPGGFVTVDKPPVGFWVQAAFVALFGWSGLALQLPQAIAGTMAVPLLYVLVARTFGTAAGLIAAFALAITPVSVAVDRNNTIDAQLALIVLAAAYAVVRAAERGDPRWLALAGALVGLGFNVKMSQAYLAVPAFGLAYLAAARTGIVRRVAHLAVFGAVTLAVSFAWIAVADLTPRGARPYIGSSTNDSALQLALGHNGAARLGPLALDLGAGQPRPPGQPVPAKALPAGPQPGQPVPPGPGPQNEVGEHGI